MKRVLVIGSCGAGKSTFSRRLHEITKLKLIHLDKIYHLPNWEEPPEDEWLIKLKDIIKGDEWIIDGNFGSSMELRLERCETVIWLDLPRRVCVWRVLKRNWLYRNRVRPDMAEGCEEKFDPEFIKYVWRFQKDKNPAIEMRMEKFAGSKNIFRLKSEREIEKLLAGISGR